MKQGAKNVINFMQRLLLSGNLFLLHFCLPSASVCKNILINLRVTLMR